MYCSRYVKFTLERRNVTRRGPRTKGMLDELLVDSVFRQYYDLLSIRSDRQIHSKNAAVLRTSSTLSALKQAQALSLVSRLLTVYHSPLWLIDASSRAIILMG